MERKHADRGGSASSQERAEEDFDGADQLEMAGGGLDEQVEAQLGAPGQVESRVKLNMEKFGNGYQIHSQVRVALGERSLMVCEGGAEAGRAFGWWV